MVVVADSCIDPMTGYKSTISGGVMAKEKGNSKVTIYPDWCKGCGICVAFCPAKVIELDGQGKAQAVREEDCIHCGFCELHCPDFAIVVTEIERCPK